jgi:anti-anti-sigma factor
MVVSSESSIPWEAAVTETLAFHLVTGWDGPVLRLSGEIDIATVGPIRDHLLALDDAILTLDFCDVTFMGAAGVNLLVQLQRRLRERGGKLVLYGIQPNQMRVLAALELADFFDCVVPD